MNRKELIIKLKNELNWLEGEYKNSLYSCMGKANLIVKMDKIRTELKRIDND